MAKNLLKGFVSEVKMRRGLLDTKALISAIEAGYLPKESVEFKKKKSFAPSGLVYGSGECPRYWYLAFEGGDFESDSTPAQIANMRNGTKSHERIQEAVRATPIFLSEEKRMVSEDPPIFGFQDLELLWDGGSLPAEIKTTNSLSFQRRKDSGTALNYHISQLLIYMKIELAEMGVIIYENKDNHELFAVAVEMDEKNREWVDEAFEWMRTVYKAWTDKTLPRKNYRANSKICKGCPLSKGCAELPSEGEAIIPSLEKLG